MDTLMTYEGFCIDGPISGEYLKLQDETVFVPVYPRMSAVPVDINTPAFARVEYTFHVEPSGLTYWSIHA